MADTSIPQLGSLLQAWGAQMLGARGAQSVVGDLTRGGVAAAICIGALALLLNVAAAGLLRHHARRAERDVDGGGARSHVLRATGKPLYLMIWLIALYFALAPLLLALGRSLAAQIFYGLMQAVLDLGLFAVALWLCYRLTRVLDQWLQQRATRSKNRVDDVLFPLVGRSLRVLLPVLGVIFGLPLLHLPTHYLAILDRASSVLLIIAMALIAVRAARTFESALLLRFDIHATDNLRARKLYTQVRVISKVIDVTIALFAAASILMLFSEVRHVGTSLLASAGIVGIVAGVAAQKPLSNLMAGFQIAMAQPIRQDDVLVVEGEWGRVEEITLTYIVLHIWDDRRLVLPLSYFIEKPFQNWTRSSAQLLGSVIIWMDYSLPVAEVRSALKQIVESSALWDRRFWNLQVSDADSTTMQLRVLATAADSSSAWDLRCEIREKLIAHIQEHYPQSLPRVRTQVTLAKRHSPVS